MAVEIKVKNKGLKIEDFVDRETGAYGVHDEHYRLTPEKVGNPLIVYNPEKLGRGFEIFLEKKEICLSQPLPTSREDIRFFYGYVVKLLKLLGTEKFYRNDEPASVFQIADYMQEDIDTSINAMGFLSEKAKEDGEQLYIFALMNPIALGENTIEKIGGDLDRFADYLHEVQAEDYFYAAPLLYQNNETGKIMGAYVVSPDVSSVLPNKPTIFNPEIKVDEWFLVFFLENEDIFETMIPYDVFLLLADKNDLYDEGHFMITYAEAEMRRMLEKARGQ